MEDNRMTVCLLAEELTGSEMSPISEVGDSEAVSSPTGESPGQTAEDGFVNSAYADNATPIKELPMDDPPIRPRAGRRRSIIKDPSTKTGIRANKKSVSFSRLPSESTIRNAADCVNLMQMGHQFIKLRSNARIYNRFYWFDLATNSLKWEPSKKDAGKAKIDISSIKAVRPGKVTESFVASEITSHFHDQQAFSIIHSDYKNLDLIAGSVDEANTWIAGLRCLIGGHDPEELQTRPDTRDVWLSSVFESADANGDGYLDEEESLALLKSLSDGIRETRIKQKLTEFLRFKDRDRTRLTKDEFVELFKDVTTRPEIYFLLARHASADDRLSVEDLMLFLESEQGVTDITRERCVELIEQFEPSVELKDVPAFGIDGFTKYLNPF